MAVTYQLSYRASSTIAVGSSFNALPTSSTRTAGAQTDQYDNTTNLDDDVLLSGSVKMGTSPTAGTQVDIWVFACKDESSAYPDVITAAGNATKTLTSENVRNAAGKLLKSIQVDATTGRVYDFSNESVAALFGGVMPAKFVVFVAHNTAANLDASTSAFVTNALGIKWQGV